MGPRMLLEHKEKRLRIMSVGCGDMPVYLHEKKGWSKFDFFTMLVRSILTCHHSK